jgi:hypothetical protein
MTTSLPDLTEVGNIPAEYHHIAKLVSPADGLALPDAYLKWYEVRRPDAEIPDELRIDAREFLQAEVAAGRLNLSGELGFVIHHLCGESFYFLIVCSWRNLNEMWETLYAQDMATGGGYRLVPQGSHLEVICVWELGAVLHEQQAWTRYLRSPREEQDKRAYLEDRFTGTV